MDTFLIVLVVVFIIILITIIGVVIFLIVDNPENPPPTTGCVSNEGCSTGFICQAGVCKAGIGTACTQNSDCGTNLRCDTSSQVCVPNTPSQQSKESSLRPRKTDVLTITPPPDPPPASLNPPPASLNPPSPPLNPPPLNPPPLNPPPASLNPPSPLPSSFLDTLNPPTFSLDPKPAHASLEPPPVPVTLGLELIPEPSILDLMGGPLEPPVGDLVLISRPGSSHISNTPLSSPDTPPLPVRNPTTRTVVRQLRGSTTPMSELESYATSSPRPRRRPPIESSPSSDDEINSWGSHSDQPFDIRSGLSTPVSTDQDSVTQISTPCQEHDGIYYCRSLQAQIEEIDSTVHQSSPVIDVCTYSDATLFLLEDGHIIAEREAGGTANKVRLRITNTIKLIQIRGFSGYIYGVDFRGDLHFLPNNYFGTTNWRWSPAGWAPGQIKHLSTTHDGGHLWLQTDGGSAYLYDRPHHCILELEAYTYRRVYGRDLAHYLEIDTTHHTAILHPEQKHLSNVCDGALSYYDEVVAIHPADRAIYRGITIVNWRPYYIRY